MHETAEAGHSPARPRSRMARQLHPRDLEAVADSNPADIVPSKTATVAIVCNITKRRGEVPLHTPVPSSELYCLYGLGGFDTEAPSADENQSTISVAPPLP